MPLELQKAVDADMPRIADIYLNATARPWLETLAPNGISPASRNIMIENNRKDLCNSHCAFMKVVDTDLGNEVIAFAKWFIYRKERPKSEWDRTDSREWGPDWNLEALQEFFGQLGAKKRKHVAGMPHCCKQRTTLVDEDQLAYFSALFLLDTHPNHQRRGAGTMLVQWGANVADEAGLCCYLEGTSAGYSLYQKMGFKDVDVVDIDMGRWGKEGIYRHVCMIRPAKVASSEHQ